MMNYVGSISVLDRGDGPAQAVLDKNARSLAQRVADETKDELTEVMNRVDNIYGNFEMTQQVAESNRLGNLEYVNDLYELEDLLTDQVKKKKYQQQITVFIVGYENVCGQKLKLLQQVNEFFMDNTRKLEEDDQPVAPSPDINLDEVSKGIEESLETAEQLTHRIADLNKEMVDYLANYAQSKASNKGRKKLERALGQAKEDVQNLSEKLMQAQQDLEDREDKMQQMFKQVEVKNMEIQKYKTAAEVAKKSAGEADSIREALEARNEKINEMKRKIDELMLDVAQKEHSREQSQIRLKEHSSTNMGKIKEVEEELETVKINYAEEKRELIRYQDSQVTAMSTQHREEIERLSEEHREEIKKLMVEKTLIEEDLRKAKYDADVATAAAVASARNSSQQDNNKQTPKVESPAKKKSPSTSPGKQIPPAKPSSKQPTKSTKETADMAIQDEGGDPDTAITESRKTTKSQLEVVQETVSEFENEYPLDDEESWITIPKPHIHGRFMQYRKLTRGKIKELQDKLNITQQRTNKKVTTLKAQFQEHKSKWEQERQLLMEQFDQAQILQVEAEKEADSAMSQLEEFINDQESLEQEEDEKRKQLTMSHQRTISLADAQASLEATLQQNAIAGRELTQLLQQTDDAKVADLSSRLSQTGKLQSEDTSEQPSINIGGTTDEEIRVSSAASRASLRSKYKSSLDEKRAALEDRRSRSPAISIHSQPSFHDAVLDENADMPFPDDVKGDQSRTRTLEIGTSPPPSLLPKSREASFIKPRQGLHVIDHPITQSYLQTYDKVIVFKDDISKILMDKDMMSLSQVLTELETLAVDKSEKITPQIEEMTMNTYQILEEVTLLMNNILASEREYPVSSLNTVSRGRMGLMTREKSFDDSQLDAHTPNLLESRRSVALSAKSFNSKGSDYNNLKELQEQFDLLQKDFKTELDKNQYELNRNAVMMMEMQDTISHLQRELAIVQNKLRQTLPAEEPADASIMFTRLDSERNSKALKQAVMEMKVEPEKYKDAVETMEKYVSLPAKRFSQLVKKYVHHCSMKKIEANVRKSKSLNEDVFDTLDKMEALQNVRARRWAESMDGMGDERLRLAHTLMETLDALEQESGIFMVKPMYSYRGRIHMEKYTGKIRSTYQPRGAISRQSEQFAPLPTPASNFRPYYQPQSPKHIDGDSMQNFLSSQPEQDPEITGTSVNWVGDRPQPMWNMNQSQARNITHDNSFLQSSLLNTPRILELDVNRMMIGQNNISSKMPYGLSDDRLVNAAHTNLRSYVTVNRPTINRLPTKTQYDRPNSAGAAEEKRHLTTPLHTPHPPSSAGTKSVHTRGKSVESDLPPTLPSTSPLPPISPQKSTLSTQRPNSTPLAKTDSNLERPVPPRSPPGSSLRPSPPPIDGIETPQLNNNNNKVNSRPTSEASDQGIVIDES